MPKGKFIIGDCLEVLAGRKPESVDLVVADLPYGKTHNKWDCCIELDAFWTAIKRVTKPEAPVILFATQPFATQLINSNPSGFRYDLVWLKNKSTGHLNANRMPMRQHELLLVFYDQLPQFNPQMSSGHKPVNEFYTRSSGTTFGKADDSKSGGGSTQRYPTSVLDFSVVNNDDDERIHSAQKPVDLLAYLVRTYSSAGDRVLDPCAGSGSLAVACVRENRKYLCVEINAEIASSAKAWVRNEKKKVSQP